MTDEEFKKLRLKIGVSQEKLATLLNMTRRNVLYYESGSFDIPKLQAHKFNLVLFIHSKGLLDEFYNNQLAGK
jgi:transcriptional regulator with XRE-family HTH domain